MDSHHFQEVDLKDSYRLPALVRGPRISHLQPQSKWCPASGAPHAYQIVGIEKFSLPPF